MIYQFKNIKNNFKKKFQKHFKKINGLLKKDFILKYFSFENILK
jgi:hypothetical protein